MKVWILQTGEPLPIDDGSQRPMRGINLTNILLDRGHEVSLLSADFNHQAKSFRGLANQVLRPQEKLEIRLLPSSGYRRNVGIARLLDHAILAFGLRRRLSSMGTLPDVAFIGYPPIETAWVSANWLAERGVPILLDVKDQWPIIFSAALPGPSKVLGPVVFSPYYWLARKSMLRATGISAMAEGFLDWALDFCGRARGDFDAVFPLTSPVRGCDRSETGSTEIWWDQQGVAADECANIMFVGSFSRAFDFRPLRNAAAKAEAERQPIRFVLCGDGGELPAVKAMMRGLDNVVFPGWIDRPKIETLATRSIAAIAPYRSSPDFELSIPNKIIDALALGLPIISPLRGEVEALIENDGVGMRYDDTGPDPGADLYRVIQTLAGDETRRQAIVMRAHELYAARFSFEQVYGGLADHLERMAQQAKMKSGCDEDR